MLSLIVATDKNSLIGKNNKIPWHVKEDLLYYKEKTNNKTVIMGLQTYNSLLYYYKTKPLPYKKIYVCTRQKITLENVIIVNDLKSFLLDTKFEEEVFVVGGSQIYKIALDYVDMMYISIIKGDFDGDTYFPSYDKNLFEQIQSTETEKVIFNIYKRK